MSKKSHYNVECPQCGKEVKSLGLAAHKMLSHSTKAIEFRRKAVNIISGRPNWNSGKTKETDPRVARAARNQRLTHPRISRPQSEVTKRKLSQIAIADKRGGYKPGAGYSKQGWYEGYWCDSTWELAWVIYQLEHGIKFERNHRAFDYVLPSGRKARYFPDFYLLEEDALVEIKGYVPDAEIFKRKSASVDKQLVLIDKVFIVPYLDYAVSRYGKNLEKLYGEG